MKYLFISSKDRKSTDTPSDYVIQIDPPLKQIQKIELVHFMYSHTLYTLNETNNYIVVDTTRIELPVGIYSSIELSHVILSSLENTFPQTRWSVRVDRMTMAIHISASNQFTIQDSPFFKFDIVPLFHNGWYTTKSKMLSMDDHVLSMDIEFIGKLIQPEHGGRASFHRFARIPLKTLAGTYVSDTIENPIIHDLNPSKTIDRIHIQFNNESILDHVMLLRLH
jgi:hypothetical protein